MGRAKPPRGSHDRPYSALNLRLLMAVIGVVVCIALGAIALTADFTVLAVFLWVLAVVGVVDIVVVLRRRRQRGPGHGSLFE
ncbi:uncharacterized membrane protein HdeD (DUF308 family) [Spinactinospora alkalitolerans]|uniref:Uncharacterized membrane protein HdeD (DUF308 family) n=1 Tax=Spinactinospora alkalitolerans TaxID=687207 RepID=A0A852U8Z0_9ACTN|nr:DUF6343 family protein [Spinactinospora alkalitolerans]NYE50400.1 uncharacterized membrane protein HdeD (DUF308 family) [Spinactinospora alkalitolerans]